MAMARFVPRFDVPCRDCGTPVPSIRRRVRVCPACKVEARGITPRTCVDCHVDISARSAASTRCEACQRHHHYDSDVSDTGAHDSAWAERRMALALAILKRRRRAGRPIITMGDQVSLLGSSLHGGRIA